VRGYLISTDTILPLQWEIVLLIVFMFARLWIDTSAFPCAGAQGQGSEKSGPAVESVLPLSAGAGKFVFNHRLIEGHMVEGFFT